MSSTEEDILLEKMSTKICQLTRVVYLLNNKYLDAQSNIEAIKTRIEAFHNETEPGLKWVEENWWLIHIDANRSENEIFEDVLRFIDK